MYIFLVAVIKMIPFLISSSENLLLAYKKVIDFYILIS
jgi:hypothetical protein